MYVKNGTGILKRVLLSKPDFLKKAAPINEIAVKWSETDLDREKILQEYLEFIKVYGENGIETEFAPTDPKAPNAVFSRDFGGCVKEGYILGNFKEPLRYQERIIFKQKMRDLGIPLLGEVTNGFFEGGDFAFLNETTIAVGMAARTDETGFKEVRDIVEPLGYTVVPVKCKAEYLHLDMCFNLVDDHLAVAYIEGMPTAFLEKLAELKIEIIPIKEEQIFEHGCNLQSIGAHRVLSLTQNETVNKELVTHGMKVIPVEISEILKAGGGLHCMTFPLSRV